MSRRIFLPLLLALASASGSVEALAADAGKNAFHLFNPTPRELLRALSTDRPDKTESAYTVDAGHFQIETDLINYSLDRYNGDPTDTRTAAWSFANTNFKVGLFNHVDLQLIVPTFNHVRTEDRSIHFATEHSGFGDLSARMKINLWGNDGGRTAFALMPFVKFPTAPAALGNGAYEGGLIVPLSMSLPCDWQMGLMTEFDFDRASAGSGYHVEFINTITVSHAIAGDLGGYVEFFSAVSSAGESNWVGTVDLGLTYALGPNAQLDAGINLGVTRAADDFNPFLGISWRF